MKYIFIVNYLMKNILRLLVIFLLNNSCMSHLPDVQFCEMNEFLNFNSDDNVDKVIPFILPLNTH